MKSTFILLYLLFSVVVIDAQSELWGVSSVGGTYNGGTIYKTDGSGNNYNVDYNFYFIQGRNPIYTNFVQTSDGKLYGMNTASGFIFQYDPITNIYEPKYEFDVTHGSNPNGSLMIASDGNLYGMTYDGGVHSKGVLFQYNPTTNVYTKKIDFSGISNGSNPTGDLIQASDGLLYGMTSSGGVNNKGILFQYNITSNTLTKKLDFAGTTNGAIGYGSLIQANNGFLYGMTSSGGINNLGVIFQYDITTSSYLKKIDFNGSINGSYPYGSLMQATDGNLYGMTNAGGLNNSGVLFKYDLLVDSFIKKVDFFYGGGRYPFGKLSQDSTGSLYGMTKQGGLNDLGVIFKYDPVANNYIKKMDFAISDNGTNPKGSLFYASDGKFYGMTFAGGVSNLGVIFQYNPSTDFYTVKLKFEHSESGFGPPGVLTLASDGNLYGIAAGGGLYNAGVLFQYNPATHIYTKKYDFTYFNCGGHVGNLIEALDGKLYGTRMIGGTNNLGVLFQYDPVTNVFTDKINFAGASNGQNPLSLISASDGKIYGLTYKGGSLNLGTLFQYDPSTNILIKKVDFNNAVDGIQPVDGLLQASNGLIYGTAEAGGINSKGVLFEYNPLLNTYLKKLDFGGSINGTLPSGSLLQANDGKCYGVCRSNLSDGKSEIFQYDINTNAYTTKFIFLNYLTDGGGSNPQLIQASDGNLYGTSNGGGMHNQGVIYQFNMLTDTFTKKHDFIWQSYPSGTVVEVGGTVTKTNIYNKLSRNDVIFPNPNTGIFSVLKDDASTIIVINSLGEEIFSQTYSQNERQINIHNQPPGIYFVKINYKNGLNYVAKVVKQ
jgi:uncharacterized repeat protein (TIGR03803 family)